MQFTIFPQRNTPTPADRVAVGPDFLWKKSEISKETAMKPPNPERLNFMAGFLKVSRLRQIMEVENGPKRLVSKGDIFHFHDGGRKGSQE